MKILLVAINAKYIHSCLATYALLAYAKQQGMEVEMREYTINHNPDHILEDIYMSRPDMVAFSCYLWNVAYVNELTYELANLLPDMDIWLGGPEVSYDGKEHLQTHPEVKGIIVGEGEETFLEVCNHYHGVGALEEIKGIIYRAKEAIKENPPRPCMNLDDLPFTYPDLNALKHRMLYYESSRGCPFHCSYCLSSVDRNLRFKSLPKVFSELQIFLDAKVPQVKFVDRTYNAKVSHAMAIWQYIKDHDNGVTNFHFEIAADILKEEELQLLESMREGLVQLEIGVQSTYEKTISEIHRVMDVDVVAAVTKRLKKAKNMNLHLDLIVGLPYEDYETFQKSFNDLHAMRPHQLQLGFLKVLKGSYMYEHAQEYGILYHKRAPYEVLRTNWIDFDKIIMLKEVEEMLEMYYNSGQYSTVLGVVFALEKEHNPFGFYRKLADYYKEKGYLTLQHSRMKKYEILLDFLMEEYEEALHPMLKEAALYDLYLRDNIKSRPSFAKNLTKEELRYKKEHGAKKHMEVFRYDFSEGEFYYFAALPKKETVAVVFDYENKNLITGNVKTMRLENDQEGTCK
ncbi:MAG: B12-binding domain-containing radical SAM protein [Lachnospiraceae bacterium]|nr:B12-binding domain-containing radical SAM protein [Lachnospiraceae bacterium]